MMFATETQEAAGWLAAVMAAVSVAGGAVAWGWAKWEARLDKRLAHEKDRQAVQHAHERAIQDTAASIGAKFEAAVKEITALERAERKESHAAFVAIQRETVQAMQASNDTMAGMHDAIERQGVRLDGIETRLEHIDGRKPA